MKIDKKRYMEVPKWRKEFTAFGDRLDFLSEERQHLQTGRLKILPAKNPKRGRDE